MYSCHLFLIVSASVRSIAFLSFIKPIFARNVPLVSLIFLKRSLVFPTVLFSSIFALIAEEGFLISPCYSLELCIQMGIRKHHYEQSYWGWWHSSWVIWNPKRWCCENATFNMPANMENSAVATGLEKVSFYCNPKERQCQKVCKLQHDCTHLTC